MTTLDYPIQRRHRANAVAPNLSVSARPAWMDDAACSARIDDDIWYPPTSASPTVPIAKAVCARCPVLAECRRHALAVPERHGIWGGFTEAERSRLLRGRSA